VKIKQSRDKETGEIPYFDAGEWANSGSQKKLLMSCHTEKF